MILFRLVFSCSLFLLAFCSEAQMVLTGVFDAQPAASGAKGVELFVSADIADASIYEIGSANNGSGNIEGEFRFPEIALSAGTYIYLAADSSKFSSFFGFDADYITGAMNINGNDAIVLLQGGSLVDVYGEPEVDGEGTIWEHTDGWAYRKSGSSINTRFDPADWTFSGLDALRGGGTNAEAPIPFPLGTYRPDSRPQLRDDNYFMMINDTLVFNPLENDVVSFDPMTTIEIADGPTQSAFFVLDETAWLYVPVMDYCGLDSLDYEICNADGCDTARVIIEIDCNTGLPLYSIQDINGLNGSGEADSINVECRLRGIVHSIDYQENGHSFFIQDDPGAGIMCFTRSDTGIDVEIGQEFEISGSIGQFNGQLQIFIDSLELISDNNPLFGPRMVTELDEGTESIFIKMDSVRLNDPADWRGNGSSFNVQASLPSGYEFTIRIDDQTVFSNLPAPEDFFTLQGIGSQFDREVPLDEGYQIFPRILEDISPYDTTITYTEYTIADLREDGFDGVPVHLGEKVATLGVPVGVNYNSSGESWALVDAFDRSTGIHVFSADDDLGFSDDFNIGVYLVRGTLDQFNGLSQIIPDDIEFQATITVPLTPILVSELNENTESRWIQMENMRIVNAGDWTAGSGGSGFNVDFENEQGQAFTVRVDADVELFNQAYPFDENTPVRLTGIGGQFDRDAPFNSGYQLLVYDLEMMSRTDDEYGQNIKVYPTICREQVMIQVPVASNFEMVNTQGVTVAKGYLLQGYSSIDISDLNDGWHFLRIGSNDEVEVRKILIKK